jgi:hypothetical protein
MGRTQVDRQATDESTVGSRNDPEAQVPARYTVPMGGIPRYKTTAASEQQRCLALATVHISSPPIGFDTVWSDGVFRSVSLTWGDSHLKRGI